MGILVPRAFGATFLDCSNIYLANRLKFWASTLKPTVIPHFVCSSYDACSDRNLASILNVSEFSMPGKFSIIFFASRQRFKSISSLLSFSEGFDLYMVWVLNSGFRISFRLSVSLSSGIDFTARRLNFPVRGVL